MQAMLLAPSLSPALLPAVTSHLSLLLVPELEVSEDMRAGPFRSGLNQLQTAGVYTGMAYFCHL
jgi:hypothetical protein